MDPATLAKQAAQMAAEAQAMAEEAAAIAAQATQAVANQAQAAVQGGDDPFVFLFTIFVLACFVGFYVVWSVTPALHSPLMSVTNAISSVIVVGGLIAIGMAEVDISRTMGFLAVMLASVNIFGGFIVTQRMLAMFKKKK